MKTCLKHWDSHLQLPVILNYPLVMTNVAIENGPVEIVDLPIKNGGSFHSYFSLPEGTR